MTHTYHKDGALPDGPAVFAFGSNALGIHAGGAARVALRLFGAVEGQATGRQGDSYAIVTADRYGDPVPLAQLAHQVERFLCYATLYAHERFFVTRVGCGIVGYDDAQVAPLFKGAPSNCSLPEPWRKWIEG